MCRLGIGAPDGAGRVKWGGSGTMDDGRSRGKVGHRAVMGWPWVFGLSYSDSTVRVASGAIVIGEKGPGDQAEPLNDDIRGTRSGIGVARGSLWAETSLVKQ
jgi:hypothetical protein